MQIAVRWHQCAGIACAAGSKPNLSECWLRARYSKHVVKRHRRRAAISSPVRFLPSFISTFIVHLIHHLNPIHLIHLSSRSTTYSRHTEHLRSTQDTRTTSTFSQVTPLSLDNKNGQHPPLLPFFPPSSLFYFFKPSEHFSFGTTHRASERAAVAAAAVM
mgnify:CR=1 FL=1